MATRPAGYKNFSGSPFYGNDAGPSTKFKVATFIGYSEQDPTRGYHVWQAYAFYVTGSGSSSTLTSDMKTSWGVSYSVSSASSKWYPTSDFAKLNWIDRGWLTPGKTVSKYCWCKYTGGSGSTYLSEIKSGSVFTIPKPAGATYTITYNANGGSGAPSAQTKTQGVALKLSSTKPSRSGYSFKEWNTRSDGKGSSYSSGATYSANASVTLYAIWTAQEIVTTNQVSVKVNAAYRKGTVWVKTNGVYRKASKIYVKASGTYRESK